MKKTLAFCLLALVATAAWAGQAAETEKSKARPAATTNATKIGLMYMTVTPIE